MLKRISKKFDNDRKTKIICTLGPSSSDEATIRKLLLAGMNCARLNFSHGSHDDKRELIGRVRSVLGDFRDRVASSELQIDWSDGSNESVCALLSDLKGPEIRTGVFTDGAVSSSGKLRSVLLKRGDTVELSCDPKYRDCGDTDRVFVDYAGLARDFAELGADRWRGRMVMVDDGLLALRVDDVDEERGSVQCHVMNGGPLGERKGINLPGMSVALPAVTERDEADIRFSVEQRVDFIAASFVRRRSHVETIRERLHALDGGASVRIVAKIENEEGLENFDEIMEASDGIMVARGDLGIEIPAHKVFAAQKEMIRRCNLAGKTVITATQMLESMTVNPRPTRAEVSDVANAVLDGTDCVMLSGETAKGDYPVEAVEHMSALVQAAEARIDYVKQHRELVGTLATERFESFEALAAAAVGASLETNASMIVVSHNWKMSGRSGRLVRNLARFRPQCPIVLVSQDQRFLDQISLMRGVHQLFFDPSASVVVDNNGGASPPSDTNKHDMSVSQAVQLGKQMGVLKSGDTIILVYTSFDELPSGRIIPNPTMKISVAV
jgi:pyruvate kinase